jgi:two-component system, LytTR family, response regulator
MEKISCIIVDDEIQNQEVLARMLDQFCPTVEVLGRAPSVDEAILLIDKFKPKIVFLDVEMPGGSGFTLFDRITKPTFFTIFTTAHADYAIRAIKIAALDFLLKPINLTELRIAVEKVAERLRNQSENDQTNTKKIEVLNANKRGNNFEFKKIALPTTEGLEFYLVKDILRCEADRAYCIFHLTGKRRIVVSKSLKEYVDILEEASFFRVHKSNMVNVQHITKYIRGKGGHVLLNDGSLVAVAVRKKEELLAVLAHHNVTE